jgi:hypothetical protein
MTRLTVRHKTISILRESSCPQICGAAPGLDFDLVLQYRMLPGDDQPTLLTRVAPYFNEPEYSRPVGQRRVVCHIDFHDVD